MFSTLFTTYAVPKAMALAEIKEATKKYNTLQQMAKIIHEDSLDSVTKCWWTNQ